MGLVWTAKASDAPDIEEGWYPADFKGVSEFNKGQYGPGISWDFTAYINGDPEPVSRVTSTSTSIKSEGFKILSGILGRQPEVDEDIKIDSLIDKRVEVKIEKNDAGWPRVVKVRVPEKAKA